ncbi:hypothetical protein [Halomonas ventosae]|uniref:hypothetical protein n=1 Tax=Halomonas ventosae TaxID=229007 RepID=UPI0011B21110|nr:hypothetical protein [Halomonas ventosae]
MLLAWVVNPNHERAQIKRVLGEVFSTFEKHGCWYLSSDRLYSESLVGEKAWFSRRIDAVNGFIRISSVPMNPIEVAGWYFINDGGEIRPILEAPSNLVANHIEERVRKQHADFVKKMMNNQVALDAYAHMSRHGDWYGLYKAHETLDKNIEKEDLCVVVAKKEWRRLRQTANSHRHSKYGSGRVDVPMAYHDAQHIIKKVLNYLVESQG